jgi:NAD(P)-dependent dehydrogenase (short-subunit alcohol dehydrogenase family)
VEVENRVVVVTGGASGIGRALALAFADAGARGVVVADVNADGARTLAGEIGNRAIDVTCDVTDAGQVDELITAAEDAFGPVDIFCANAGVGTGMGIEATDEVWDFVLGVNTRAHIYAARRLVPGWVERGEGYFVTTASAAGVLTQIGDAPYSVSKHAAVAFAEWLSITYGARGIRVSCLCPMGVNTPLLHQGLDSADSDEALGARVVAAAGNVLEPEEVAEHVLEAVRDEHFLVLPHPEVHQFMERKASDPDRWLAGMRRLQAQVMGGP